MGIGGGLSKTYLDANYVPSNLPTNAGSRTRRYDATRCLYNAKPANTSNLRPKIAAAQAGLGLMSLYIAGDSKVAGFGSNGGSAIAGTSTWPGRVRTTLAARSYPIAGTGLVFAYSNSTVGTDSRWSFVGSWTQTGSTNTNFATIASSAKTATFVSDVAGTVVEVYTLGVTAAFDVTIDGVLQTRPTPSGGTAVQVFTFSGLTNATHTVVITTTSASTTYLYGVNVRGATGIQIHNAGICGSSTADWSTATYFQAKRVTTALTCDAILISLGVNDARSGTLDDLVTFKAQYQLLIDWQRSQQPTRDVIIVVPAVPDTAQVTQARWDNYVSAHYDLADSNDVPLVDLTALYGTYTAANSRGLMYGDGLHENALGYAADAAVVLNAISA